MLTRNATLRIALWVSISYLRVGSQVPLFLSNSPQILKSKQKNQRRKFTILLHQILPTEGLQMLSF